MRLHIRVAICCELGCHTPHDIWKRSCPQVRSEGGAGSGSPAQLLLGQWKRVWGALTLVVFWRVKAVAFPGQSAGQTLELTHPQRALADQHSMSADRQQARIGVFGLQCQQLAQQSDMQTFCQSMRTVADTKRLTAHWPRLSCLSPPAQSWLQQRVCLPCCASRGLSSQKRGGKCLAKRHGMEPQKHS